MHTEQLIEKVKANPGLYNKQSHEYKNILVKERLWAKIARELHCDVRTCKVKWKSLRDRYAREIKKETLSSEAMPISERWECMETLSFLKNALRPRRSVRSFVDSEAFLEELASVDVDVLANDHTMDIGPTSSTMFSATSYSEGDAKSFINDKKPCTCDISTTLSNFAEEMKNMSEPKQPLVPSTELTDTEMFGKVIAKKLEMLPTKKRNNLETKILCLVNETINNHLDGY